MKKSAARNYLFYVCMLIVFAAGMVWIIQKGNLWESSAPAVSVPGEGVRPSELFVRSLTGNIGHPLSMLLLQIIAILLAVRVFSYLFKYLGQPGVIGEIVAGIVLGPSVLGYFFPEAFSFLFAPDSLGPLNIMSQIGLFLFMFVIGMELDLDVIRKKASETLVISHASIVVPFFFGAVLAYFVYPEFGAGHTSFLPFALFIGISVSITAFPVLARIIQERNLGKTQMGALAIASAANNDVTAWCMLAAIIAVANAGSVVSSLYTLGATAVYLAFMFLLVRPFLKKMGEIYNNEEVVSKTLVAFIFLVLILSSYITEVLGIHALFGAFVAGIVMPANLGFRRVMTEKVEDVALVLFLPLFFVFTGLRTEIGLLNNAYLWGVCAVFILVSIAGKLLGAALSARLVGETWKDSLSLGVLMNTRGLMELIVLNIGYEMGVLPSSIFVIFVIMALFTTFMATPCLMLIEKWSGRKKKAVRPERSLFPKVLISFGNPASGRTLLDLAYFLFGGNIRETHVSAVHYTIGTDANPFRIPEYSEESFAPLRQEANRLGIEVETRYQVTDHYVKEMAELANRGGYDLVLTGAGPAFIESYTHSLPRQLVPPGKLDWLNRLFRWLDRYFPRPEGIDKAHNVFHEVHSSVGVFVNRGIGEMTDIGMVLYNRHDQVLLSCLEFLPGHVRAEVRIRGRENHADFRSELASVLEGHPGNLRLSEADIPLEKFLEGKQLVLLSYQAWIDLTEKEPELVKRFPSFLAVRPRKRK